MTRHDSWIVLGVLGVLVLATIVPFALPFLPVNPFESRCLSPDNIADHYRAEFQRTHTQNLTGDGVRVAIIDSQGFAVDTPQFKENIVATESFWPGHDITNDGQNRHGTASAAIVTAIAPDADLYLANFDGSEGFIEAIDWAVGNDVDVIVAPVEFYGKPNDGTAPISTAVTNATEQGISIVVPTGNLARKHWEGTYTGEEWLAFTEGETRLSLRGPGPQRRVRVWLWWNETTGGSPGSEFDLVLYEALGNGSVRRVTASSDYPDDNVPTNELLATTVTEGTYYLRVRGANGSTHHVELFAPSHELAEPVRRGSIVAPATAEHVIVVGATHRRPSEGLPMSSRGPTNDGRLGVDVVAPGEVSSSPCRASFTGSSVAAAYTGGVVSLLTAKHPDLSPVAIETLLKETATPAGTTGVDFETGYGMVNASAVLTQEPERSPVTRQNGTKRQYNDRPNSIRVGERESRPIQSRLRMVKC